MAHEWGTADVDAIRAIEVGLLAVFLDDPPLVD